MTHNSDTHELTIYEDDYQLPAIVGDAFDHDDPNVSPIRGGNVKFDGGAYFVGKEKTLVQPDRQFIVVDKASGWVYLKKGCTPEYVMHAPGTPKPERPECGDESTWPIGLSGIPEAPWKFTYFVYLIDVASGETLTFSGNSAGARIAVDELTQQIKSMRSLRPGSIPVVELSSVQMPTKFGKKPRPSFKIVNWKTRTTQEVAPPVDERDYDAEFAESEYGAPPF
jgi:hypothetical protein